MNRREFLRTAGGAAGGTAAVGAGAVGPAAASAAGGESGGGNESGGGGGGGPPDFGGYLSDAANYDGTVADATGQDEATVTVGADANNALSFGPAAIHVDNGATVIWEWSGEGGAHNVIHEGGEFDSGTPVGEAGTTFEHTFDSDGIYNYYCDPHKGAGMKGSVVVGTDYPTVATGGGPTPVEPNHMGVPFQAHFVGMATILAILMSLLFTFFTLKYGESPNVQGGNN